ncbi:10919_t:CDS:1, partial [Ambispora leptoticha]
MASECLDPEVQYKIARLYRKGIGTPVDENLAFQWYKKSADNGFNKAKCKLGKCFEKGIGVSKNTRKAVWWYKKAAIEQTSQNSSAGDYYLGSCYHEGIGTLKDIHMALRWYRKGVNKNCKLSANILLQMLNHND